MRSSAKRLWSDQSGAIAAVYALALPALIAVGGIAFDYARMAALDTELQNAADQAALAAVTQLDQTATSCTRAVAAARSLITNSTLFANDGAAAGTTVAISPQSTSGCGNGTTDQIIFYSAYTSASSNTVTTDPLAARFVSVTVNPRKAVYALTPIVALLNSGDLRGAAVAGLGSAICKVPPVMFCNPDEPSTNTNVNLDFDVNARIGRGMRLIGDGSYAPGNFGFLETNFGNGANNLLAALGWNSPPGDCAPINGVSTKPGMSASVIDGLNTRFDIDANGNTCPTIDGVTGVCSPSVNVRKDLVRRNSCGITGNGWAENDADGSNFQTRRYRPTSAATLVSTVTPEIMGLPRDLCHAWSLTGNCTDAGGRIGDGQWDINAYWRSQYGSAYGGQVSSATYGAQPNGYPTRYQVYRWEMDDLTRIGTPKSGQGSATAYSQPVANKCLATPNAPYGIVPSANTVDRRRISAAVLNCKALGVSGSATNLQVIKFVELFLVEPSFDRTRCKSGSNCNDKFTDKKDVYVEIIGETSTGAAGSTGGQVVRRDKPYLIE